MFLLTLLTLILTAYPVVFIAFIRQALLVKFFPGIAEIKKKVKGFAYLPTLYFSKMLSETQAFLRCLNQKLT
jgi:hypothetical protein